MLNVEFRRNVKDVESLPPIEDFPSGTIVEYTDKDDECRGYGMIMRDCDGDNVKIWDFEMDTYYNDYNMYYVLRELDATITIKN